MKNLKGQTLSSFIWKMCERGSSQLISMVIQIVLARILSPKDFGALAIILVFTNIANVFIQKGFSSSLIRKKDATEDDYNTAFVVSELIAVSCILLLYILAPLVANFYGDIKIAWYLRVMSISLVFGALYSIENAILVRELKFKIIFVRSIAAVIISGVIGIILALLEFGVWALVVQSICHQIILCIVTYWGCEWKPQFRFSRTSFTNIFSFGSKILIAELISMGVEEVRTLIIGKRFKSSELAYYDRGLYYPAAIMRGVYDSVSSVMLPLLSKEQDEHKKMALRIEETLIVTSFIIFPIFIGLSAISKQFVLLFLGEKWEKSILFLAVFCIYQLAFPVYGILRQSLYALGKSNSVLKLETIKGILFIIAILVGAEYGTLAIALCTMGAFYISTLLYFWYVGKNIPINIKRIMGNIGCTVIQCVVMYILIQYINMLNLDNWIQIILDVAVGIVIYLLMSVIMRNQTLKIILSFTGNKGVDLES